MVILSVPSISKGFPERITIKILDYFNQISHSDVREDGLQGLEMYIHISLTKFGPVPYGACPAMCFYLSLMPKCLLRARAKLPPSYSTTVPPEQ